MRYDPLALNPPLTASERKEQQRWGERAEMADLALKHERERQWASENAERVQREMRDESRLSDE